MRPIRSAIWLGCLIIATSGNTYAGGGHTSRTYFGGPGQGPYGPAPRYRHPWTVKVFGVRMNETPDERYEKFLRRYQVVEAKHQARLNRLNWDNYYNYLYPAHNSTAGFVGSCNCAGHVYRGDEVRPPELSSGDSRRGVVQFAGSVATLPFKAVRRVVGGGKSAGCHGCASGNCGLGCGTSNGAGVIGKLAQKLRGNRDSIPYAPPPYPGYPGMNREDALRYLEGFQYYPPRHLIRSPRDFYMFDVTHGIGR